MNRYKSKRNVLLVIDMIAIGLSFVISVTIRYSLLVVKLGSMLVVSTYEFFFTCALIIYIIFSLLRRKMPIERMSYREILLNTIEGQILFVAIYIHLLFDACRRSNLHSSTGIIFWLKHYTNEYRKMFISCVLCKTDSENR